MITVDESALRLDLHPRSGDRLSADNLRDVMADPLPDWVAAVRCDGLVAVTSDQRVARHQCSATPWLLDSAKTLSYAVNMAAL